MALHPKLGGGWAEQRALRLLREQGWRLLDRNWHCRWGEIDLLLFKNERLLLVEVKGRRRCGRDGWGVASFNTLKRQRIERAFSCWLADHPHWQHSSLELVLALVPLPPAGGGARKGVRWIRLAGMHG